MKNPSNITCRFIKTSKKIFNSIIFVFLILIFTASVTWSGEYSIIQLTDNTYDESIWPYFGIPQINTSQAAWTGYDGNDYEIFLYNGTTILQLTDNDYDDYSPYIDNGKVTWYGYDGNDFEIFFYDGAKVIQITENTSFDCAPRIHNGQLTWHSYDEVASEIFFYDGTKTIQLTNDERFDIYPQIHNGKIVWQGEDYQIYLYDGSKIIKLDGSPYENLFPQLNNGQVVWFGWDGNDEEIFFYDGTETIQLTNNNYDDSFPQIHNGQLTWEGSGEIFFYDGTKTTQLTNDNYPENWRREPQIHNGQVVWSGYDGNDYEVFLATPGSSDQPVLEVLDGSDFSAGREISPDPEKLTSGGTSVEGAVTDGVTRLLLRLPLTQLNEVTFSLEGTGNPKEDGILRSIDAVQEGQTITVISSTISQGEVAFCIYQAPEDFVRKGIDENHDGKPDDEAVSERTITLRIKSNRFPDFEFTQQIKLLRPPVVLVHGLWSSKEMWDKPKTTDDFEGKLEEKIPGIRILMPNYPNSIHFEDNKNVPYSCEGGIAEARKQLKIEKIAMVQADVLGHSMGGLLARIYAASDKIYDDIKYLRENNFYAGDINKLITLDSPHHGSFLADAGISCLRGPHSLSAEIFLKTMEKKGYSLTKGAVEDLMTTSEPIKKMNGVEINSASHTIAGDYKVTIVPIVPYTEPDDSKDFMVMGLPADYFDLHNKLIQEGYGDGIISNLKSGSDLVVSIDSQIGGLNSSASETLSHHHMAVTTQDVATSVIELLNAPPDGALFESGFPQKQEAGQ